MSFFQVELDKSVLELDSILEYEVKKLFEYCQHSIISIGTNSFGLLTNKLNNLLGKTGLYLGNLSLPNKECLEKSLDLDFADIYSLNGVANISQAVAQKFTADIGVCNSICFGKKSNNVYQSSIFLGYYFLGKQVSKKLTVHGSKDKIIEHSVLSSLAFLKHFFSKYVDLTKINKGVV